MNRFHLPVTVAYGAIFDADGREFLRHVRDDSTDFLPVERDQNIQRVADMLNSHAYLVTALQTLVQALEDGSIEVWKFGSQGDFAVEEAKRVLAQYPFPDILSEEDIEDELDG